MAAEAAQLRAVIDSTKAGATPETDARVFALRHEVNAARAKVDRIVVELPNRLRKHGRVIDIVGALERLEALVAKL